MFTFFAACCTFVWLMRERQWESGSGESCTWCLVSCSYQVKATRAWSLSQVHITCSPQIIDYISLNVLFAVLCGSRPGLIGSLHWPQLRDQIDSCSGFIIFLYSLDVLVLYLHINNTSGSQRRHTWSLFWLFSALLKDDFELWLVQSWWRLQIHIKLFIYFSSFGFFRLSFRAARDGGGAKEDWGDLGRVRRVGRRRQWRVRAVRAQVRRFYIWGRRFVLVLLRFYFSWCGSLFQKFKVTVC